MAELTSYDNEFLAPMPDDPANYGLVMDRLATEIDDAFTDLEDWSAFLAGTLNGEVGAPIKYYSSLGNQPNYLTSTEKPVLWDNAIFSNTGPVPPGELILPDQEQRYWWWMGVNLLLSAATPTTGKYTARLYVQDRDPATGQVLQGQYRYNQYMQSVGINQFLCFDGLFRTGGGRQRVTLSHNNVSSISVLSGSSVWAVRICPDR